LSAPNEPLGHEDHDGQSIFLAQLGVIERVILFVCRRHHLAGVEADEFASHVKLRLVENNYGVLRKFEGRSSMATYLAVVIQRLFQDYRTRAWGKWRPSAEAKRAGPLGVLLEQLLARDGFSFEEACEIVQTNHYQNAARSELEQLAGRLPVRVPRRFEPDESLADMPSNDRHADDILAGNSYRSNAVRITKRLQGLIGRLEPQDQLVLTMRFKDGRSVAEISAALRLEQKALYRRFDRLLDRLRAGLEAEGFDTAVVRALLQSQDVEIEWPGTRTEEIL
jgi:RNA polymerase sigma factor for flagellar operon FliA